MRHPAVADCESFLEAVRRSRRLHRPWVYPPDSKERFAQFLSRSADARNESFLVCLRNTNTLVGVINLNEIILGALRGAFVGYYGFKGLEGRGYMTEGFELVLKHAFGELRLHRLEANIQPGNVRSIELARKCGFRREGFSERYLKIGGRWRDHERWAITVESWRTSCR